MIIKKITGENKMGKKINIQEMIDKCKPNERLCIPAGEWESGPICLKSHITLELERGCVIRFSENYEDYLPVRFTRWEGVECYNYSPFIYAKDCEDITICGEGILDGQGEAWWTWKKRQQAAADCLIWAESRGVPVEERVFGTEKDALRPSFLQLVHCKNIVLKDFTIKNGPQWTIHPVYCKNVYASGLHVITNGPNTDGLNPDSCENVLIENCEFATGDDCIAINSGLNEDGWRVGRPCKEIEIRNCLFKGGHAAIAIGSGMSGGVENVWIHDCHIEHTERGIRVKSMRGRGGYVRNIKVEKISMKHIKEEAIQVSMNYGSSTSVPVTDQAPVFQNIYFDNIKCEQTAMGIGLCGLPESPIQNIVFQNISFNKVI